MSSGDAIHVRAYQHSDAREVLALAPRLAEGVASWRDAVGVGAAVRSWVIDAIDNPDVTVLVAEVDGAVVGFGSVCEREHWSGGCDAYVGELAVDQTCEGRGVGRAIVDAAIRWARERDVGALTLDTGAANARARRFYAGLGFREEDVRLTLPLG